MASAMSDFKKKKAEEEARQSGQLAPEVDVESGKMINPHNPEYITKRPWYLGDSGPSLKHHAKQRINEPLRLTEAEEILHQHRQRLVKNATHYRKGACENCGAMTHKKSECVERPRSLAKSAKVSGMDIAPDELSIRLEEFGQLGWDGKRDQWSGFRPEDHNLVIERFQKLEEERKRRAQERKDQKFREKEERKKEKQKLKLEAKEKAKEEKRTAAAAAKGEEGGGQDGSEESEDEPARTTDSAGSDDSDSDSDTDYDSDEEDDDEEASEFLQKDKDKKDFQTRFARQGGLGGAQMKETVRNLRIREDTAKYLRNLDPNSAYYDPKTRSMRDNPLPGHTAEDLPYAGDNYYRNTGDTIEHARMQVFAIEAQEQNIDIHPEANPTAAILAKKKFEEEQDQEKEDQRQKIREQYGADKYVAKADPRLRLGQTESWVVYSRDGRMIKGASKAIVRSKYQEDVIVNNHTSVWGSFYDTRSRSWGYKCCHSLIKMSFCLGEEGKQRNDQDNSQLAKAPTPAVHESGEEGAADQESKSKLQGNTLTMRSDVYGDSSSAVENLDGEKLRAAVEREKRFQKDKAEADDRKRKYNRGEGVDVTVEDMEAYRVAKSRKEDPMLNYQGDDETV